MEKVFSTSVLCITEEGKTVLQTLHGKVRPGRPLGVDNADKVLLAGGFPSLSPQTPFPLSPTLQLCSDLTRRSERDLLAIAEAELIRTTATHFHSYDRYADLRVCVIAGNADKLRRFVDIYGGVVEIYPLLVEQYHHEFSVVTEIEILSRDHGYQLRYRRRSPVNRDLCTYCGACEAACPEGCISVSLQVDYDSCTFCKKCETVCAAMAVDIGGVEEKKISVPAVILFDEVCLELPEDRSGIFQEDELPEYFRTLVSFTIEEVVCHNNSICQYSSLCGIGCSRCIDSCLYDAISKDESGLKIDHIRCEDCGSCIAVCPTGSMQYGRFDDRAWLEFFRTVGLTEGTTVIVGAAGELQEFWWRSTGRRFEKVLFLEYPNIAALSSFHLLFLFSLGVRRVILLHDPAASLAFSLVRQVEATNHVASSLFDMELVAIVAPAACEDLLNIAGHHPMRRFYGDFTYENRRSKLADVLNFLICAAGRVIAPADIIEGFGDIACDMGRCTHCLACLSGCSPQALSIDGKGMSLTFCGSLCVGCGICVGLCPENALALVDDVVMDEKYFERRLLFQADPAVCKGCGKIFGTRKSLERVMQILLTHESVGADHCEYCDTCRVVRIFEAEAL